MWRALLIAAGLGLGGGTLSSGVHAATTAAAPVAGEVTIHVAPGGNDTWTGASAAAQANSGPVATLARAQVLARAAVGLARGPVRVLIAPGTYSLAAPLVFTPEDSGTASSPVTYEAASAGTVTLSGGVPLNLRTAARAGAAAVFDLPATGADLWRGGGQLFVNGSRATLARQPKAGSHWFVQRSVPMDWEPSAQSGHEAFAAAGEARTWLAGLDAAERARAIVQLMHSWNVSQHRIADFSPASGVVRITPRSKWAFLSTGLSQRWFVENVPSALTEGGEWVATPTEVRYLPRATQAAQPLVAVLPMLEQLVHIRGDAAADKWVQHLSFRGLHFAHTRHLTPDGGFVDPQAAIGVGAAVQADGARHLSFEGCRFSHTASYAIWLRSAVTDTRIVDSGFEDLGGGGVQVGVARQAAGSQATARITVANNTMAHTGRVFPGAVAVWVGQAQGVTVAHNHIHDTSYTGISVGWTWGFGPAASGGHRITNNLLMHIGRGGLSDMGGIYTLGRLPDTLISGNVIREVRAYPGYGPGPGWGGWGLYNDEGTTGVRVEDNIVVGTDSGGYHLNKGQDNLVRHNLLAGGANAEVQLSQAHTVLPQATLEGNLLIPRSAKAFDGLAGTAQLALRNNQVSAALAPSPPDLAPCGVGCSVNSARVDTGPGPRDLRFSGLDPATAARLAATLAAAGPVRAKGTPGGPDLASASVVPPDTQPTPQALAPPLPVHIDLQATRLLSQPAGLQYRPLGDNAAIRVVADESAPGGRCLQFNDSATLKNRFDPHAFALLNHDSGTSTATLAVFIDADTDFVYEWRDNARPYRTGPALRVKAAGIEVGGKRVAAARVGEWMQLRVIAPLGVAGRPWTLEVNAKDQQALKLTGLAPVSPAWRTLNYIGYISNAALPSSFCLAGLSITNSKQQN